MLSQTNVFRRKEPQNWLLSYANVNRSEGFFNDVIIKVKTKSFLANRMVLSCYSSFFEHILKRKRNRCYIVIQNVSEAAFESLIEYIYTGEIYVNQNNALDILQTADYLHIDEIRQSCIGYLTMSITLKNWLDILDVSNTCHVYQLKESVFEFVCRNLKKVRRSGNFKKLSKSNLIYLISCARNYQKNEEEICKFVLIWINFDQANRKEYLIEILKLIDFAKLSDHYLKSILSQSLIQSNMLFFKEYNPKLVEIFKSKKFVQNESKLLCVGGKQTQKKVFEVYNILVGSATKRIAKYPDLPAPLKHHRLVKLDDAIYCIGGYTNLCSDEVRKLDLSKIKYSWKLTAPMNRSRTEFGAALFSGRIIVCGGYDGDYLSATEMFEPEQNQWTAISSLNQERCGNGLVECDDSLYAIGGYNEEEILASVERLDEIDRSWVGVEPLQTPRFRSAAVSCGNFIYSIGGQDDDLNTTGSVERYDSLLNKWFYVSSLNIPRYDHCACVMEEKIYVIGGYDKGHDYVYFIECYDPSTEVWTMTGEVKEKIYEHSLVTI